MDIAPGGEPRFNTADFYRAILDLRAKWSEERFWDSLQSGQLARKALFYVYCRLTSHSTQERIAFETTLEELSRREQLERRRPVRRP